MNHALGAGFADPVRDSQKCFRAVLDAMAHPGRIHAVSGPGPLAPATGAVALALLDHETPLWLDPNAEIARDWIAFHCGAPFVTDPAACRFALALTLPAFSTLSIGTHEEPETSSTIICQVRSFETGKSFRLTGPGLREPTTLTVAGLPSDFTAIWRRNHALFPQGIDLILCAGDRLTALPRTVAIQEI